MLVMFKLIQQTLQMVQAVTFNDVGDTITLLFTNSNWVALANTGTTIA